MYTAIYIRERGSKSVWRIIGNGESFYTEWTPGHTKDQIEEYYNG